MTDIKSEYHRCLNGQTVTQMQSNCHSTVLETLILPKRVWWIFAVVAEDSYVVFYVVVENFTIIIEYETMILKTVN